jgi:chromosome partitioning protein
MIRITVLNIKGGVAKTSTCHHVSGTLAQMGLRVLLLDNDPQASLSQGTWGPTIALAIDPAETIAALYRGDRPFPELVIRPSGTPGVDLVPGSGAATDFNAPRPFEATEERQACLRDFLDEVADSYDVAIIDNPPNLYLASWASLCASDWLLVPTQPEDYGAQGLRDVRRSMAMVQAGPNPGLRLMGFLLTMVSPRRAVHQLYEERLRKDYGDLVFTARVPEAPDFVEAIMGRMPICKHKPKGASAKAIRAVAEEMIARATVVAGSSVEAA